MHKSPRVCSVPGCGRPVHARGWCQTHSKLWKTTGELRPIRLKSSSRPGTVKVCGLGFSPDCAALIKLRAAERNVSPHAFIVGVVENWHAASRGAHEPHDVAPGKEPT